MNESNAMLHKLSRDDLLLTIGAAAFFAVKALIGYFTCRHYDRRLKSIEEKVSALAAKETVY